ncbi:hypothetical protein TNCV_190951 [Trichonephila clavipes]|nr:hypothetical protein TNCV_190951 [Trichonephila clavipes]
MTLFTSFSELSHPLSDYGIASCVKSIHFTSVSASFISFGVLRIEKLDEQPILAGGWMLDCLTHFKLSSNKKLIRVTGVLILDEKSTHGLCSNFEIRCKNCGSACTFSSCENTGNKNNAPEINRRSILAMRCIRQDLESLKTFCAVMSLPNPVEQKSYDVINNKLSRVMKEVAEESMKRAGVEENSSSPDNL